MHVTYCRPTELEFLEVGLVLVFFLRFSGDIFNVQAKLRVTAFACTPLHTAYY